MKDIKHPFVFIDESGVTDSVGNKQPFFAVGFLKIYEPEFVITKLLQNHFGRCSQNKNIRNNLLNDLKINPRVITHKEVQSLLHSTSHHEYHFSNITNHNLKQYKEFIKTFASQDFEFRVLILKRKDNYNDYKDTFNYWDNYIENINWLAKYISEKNEKCILVADYCSSPSITDKSMYSNVCQFKGIANVLRNESIGCPLLQICDLLLGSVMFQFKELYGYNNNSNKVKIKRDFINYMAECFDFIKSNDEIIFTNDISSISQKQKFVIWKKYPKQNSVFEKVR